MFSALKKHPFAVEAFFEHSIVLTFAFPKEQLAHLIPECLSLDTHKDTWAFMAVALVKTKALRPKGFPIILGHHFMLIGYRVFVKYINNAGKRLRGLYILKSETDKRMMKLLGNIFTRYDYTTTDIKLLMTGAEIDIASNHSDLSIKLRIGNGEISLPSASPFADWKEARRFAGPLPFTFTYSPSTKEVLIIEGMRENWIPKGIEVLSYNIPFLKINGLNNGILANAFIINSVPYYWKKGKTEQWNQ